MVKYINFILFYFFIISSYYTDFIPKFVTFENVAEIPCLSGE